MPTENTEVANDAPQTETERLTWALVDQQITDEQMARLEELLKNDAEARAIYLQCMQMHGDLHGHFANSVDSQLEGPKPLPPTVLGFLQQGLPSLGVSMGDVPAEGSQ